MRRQTLILICLLLPLYPAAQQHYICKGYKYLYGPHKSKEFFSISTFDVDAKPIKEIFLIPGESNDTCWSSYSYNSAGNLSRKINGCNNVPDSTYVIYLYDKSEQLVKQIKSELNDKSAIEVTLFTYSNDTTVAKTYLGEKNEKIGKFEYQELRVYKKGVETLSIVKNNLGDTLNQSYSLVYPISDRRQVRAKGKVVDKINSIYYLRQGDLVKIIDYYESGGLTGSLNYFYNSKGKLYKEFFYSSLKKRRVESTDYYYNKKGSLRKKVVNYLSEGRTEIFTYYNKLLVRKDTYINQQLSISIVYNCH